MITTGDALRAMMGDLENLARSGRIEYALIADAKDALQVEDNNKLFKEGKVTAVIIPDRQLTARHMVSSLDGILDECAVAVSPKTGMSAPCPHNIVFRWKELP